MSRISTGNSVFAITVALCALLIHSSPAVADPAADEAAILKLGMTSPPSEMVGIGANFTKGESGEAEVYALYDNQPAQKAGLQQGDIIVSFNGESTVEMTTEDYEKKLDGKPGTEVKMVIRRENSQEPITLSVKRQSFSSGRRSYSTEYFPAVMEMLKPLAEKGIAAAQNSMGVFYNSGLGVERDYAQAAEWYGKAAAQGDEKALFNLGVLQHAGKGMAANREEGLKNIKAAADKQYNEAEFWLAVAAENGAKTPAAKEEALKWYIRAAEHERQEASMRVVRLLADKDLAGKHDAETCVWARLNGSFINTGSQGVDLNLEKIQRLAEQRLGAEGTKECHKKVHDMIPPSITAAKAAYEKGDNSQMDDIATFYIDRATYTQLAGPEFAQADYEEGMKWYELVANLGDPVDQREFSRSNSFGVSITINDPAAAQSWLVKAAEQGDTMAENDLAGIYATGNSYVDRNDEEALKWYLKAAEDGHQGLSALSDLYAKGKGTKQDFVEAYKWMAISESQESRGAGCGVGSSPQLKALTLRMKPEQVAEGQKRTAAWLKEYLGKGRRDGLRMLGKAYASDLLGEPNYEEAYYWLQLSAGSKPTFRSSTDKKELADIALHLTPAQLEAAKTRIAEYKKPDWRREWDKSYGSTPDSMAEKALCMTITSQLCSFDTCAAGGDCKPGWKKVD